MKYDSLISISAIFYLKSCKIIEPGWRAVKGLFSEEDDETVQDRPDLNVGDELKIKEALVMEKKTAAPPLYTEASLLSAMENAGKVIENDEARKILQQVGIGTPATRASIIETLFTRDYVKRDKKSLIPTEKGLQVYELVKDKKIGDVAMTAEWELALQKIENGEADSSTFQKEMENYASAITQELLNTSVINENLSELFCLKCQNHLLVRDKIVKCPDEECGWVQYRNVCGVLLSISDIESLLVKGKSPLIKGMKSKAGNKFNAYIVLNEQGGTSFEFENNTNKKRR